MTTYDNGAGIALGLLASAPDRATAEQQLLNAWERGADTLACHAAWNDWLANNASTVTTITSGAA